MAPLVDLEPSGPDLRHSKPEIAPVRLPLAIQLDNDPFGALQMDEGSSSAGPSVRQVEGEEVDVDVCFLGIIESRFLILTILSVDTTCQDQPRRECAGLGQSRAR